MEPSRRDQYVSWIAGIRFWDATRQVKVLWQYQGVEKATWESEGTMCINYHCFIEDEDMLSGHLIIK